MLIYLISCIVLSRLDLQTHHYLILCLSLNIICYTFSYTMRPTCWLHYLVVTSKCQVYGKRTFCIFMPLYTNDQYKKTINVTPAAQYYQTQSYIKASTSLFCSLNDTSLLSYTIYHWQPANLALFPVGKHC